MFHPLKIKVCGLRDPENVEQVCGLEPDFVGYIFFRGSKRFVGKDPDPSIFRMPKKGTGKVGVFVNEKISAVKRIFDSCCLDMVQLHGDESPAYCISLVEAGIPVIKVIDPGSMNSIGNITDYGELVRYFLFDTPGEERGGTGRKFNWDLLDEFSIPFPFLLSGGIGPGDGPGIAGICHDWLFGIDVNSRFEISPGIKDVELLESFIREIRK